MLSISTKTTNAWKAIAIIDKDDDDLYSPPASPIQYIVPQELVQNNKINDKFLIFLRNVSYKITDGNKIVGYVASGKFTSTQHVY